MRARVIAALALLFAPACRVQVVPGPPVFPMSVAWTTRLASPPTGALVSDGMRLFVASRDGSVTALDVGSGARAWKVSERGGDLAFTRDLVISRQEDGVVWGLDPTSGSARWKLDTGIAATGSSSLASDDRRVIVSGTGLAAIQARQGRLLWTTPDAVRSAPTLQGDLVVLAEEEGLRARNADTGALVWSAPIPVLAPVASDRGPSPEGIYVGTTDGRLLGLRLRDGARRWRWKIGADVRHAPALTDRLALFATYEAVLYGIGRGNGHLQWRAALPSRPRAAPQVLGQSVLVACAESDLVGYALTDGKKQGAFRLPGELQTAPLVIDRRVFVGLRDGAILALDMGVAPEPSPDPSAAPAPDPAGGPLVSPAPAPAPVGAGARP